MSSRTALAADPICREHLVGLSHPERPERYDVVMQALAGKHLMRLSTRAVNEDEMLLVHTPEYIEIAQDDVETGRRYLSTGDTDIDGHSWEAAVRAAGSVLNAVDAVMKGEARNAFCAVRPPGHHATASRGMGFCLLNNVALAARYAQKRHGVERVMIIDWDVHHGNGTQEIFYSDGSVFFFSTHQWPLYPGTGRANETGAGAGKNTTMNFPLPAGSGRAQILGAVENSLMAAAGEFRPDLVLISAGFDSRVGDLLGHFKLTDDDFRDLTRRVMEIADQHAGGRVVSLLEGGYNLEGLASATAAHVETLIGS